MVDRASVLRQCGAAALMSMVLALAACGGGGGGTGEPQGSGSPPTEAPPPVLAEGPAVSAAPNQSIVLERMQEAQDTGAILSILATGNVEALENQTLYVLVEDPASLFQPAVQVQLQSEPPGAAITLKNRVLEAPGRFQGELKVHACLDAACRSELAGSPVKIPFDVLVRAGFKLDRETVALSLPFGQEPAEEAVQVTLPPDMVGDWDVREVPHADFTAPRPTVTFVRSTAPDGRTGTLSLKIRAQSPGTYRTTFEFVAPVPRSNGTLDIARKTLALQYEVARNSELPYVFLPATGSFTRTFGDAANVFMPNPMLADVPSQLVGVEYVSWPQAASGHVLANDWFRAFGLTVMPCAGPTLQECLPPGVYQARVRYTVSIGSSTQDAFWPVTLEILPP